MSQKDNSKNDYLLELEDGLGEPLKLKLDKIKSLVAQGKELYAASFKKNICRHTAPQRQHRHSRTTQNYS